MSHRTQALPPLTGLPHLIRELRYHEASRQLIGVALVVLLAAFGRPSAAAWWVGMALVVFGIAVRTWASGVIFKNEVLATSGPYGFVRHPLYVGNIAVLGGFAWASALWWAAPLVLAFLLFYYPPAIEYEDRKLQRMFGEPWCDWSVQVRALLPRLRPYPSAHRARWSFAQSLRRNGEPIVAAYLAACAWWLHTRLP
jgi:protein-S-isoprenylcysteine O-methyltransferase Ste14